jgi:hypothetical protein
MSNHISYTARPDLAVIQMSNGRTAVFISMLALSASYLATNDRQRLLAVWLASHDQSICGIGVVSFDIAKLPWAIADVEQFEHDRAFMLRAIAGAKAKIGWSVLDYQPREDWIFAALDQFATLIAAFQMIDARNSQADSWPYSDPPIIFSRCPIHQIYQHQHGCVICNDG